MTVNPLQRFIQRQGFALLDGGLATAMEKYGADLDDELWSAKMLIEAPELIRQVHSEFLDAGADVIATATYQASFEGFGNKGYSPEKAAQLMRLSVDLAVLARENFWSETALRHERLKPLVADRPRLEVLADTDADLIAFETIPSLLEAEALVELLEEFPDKTAWLSFSCRDGQSTSHGESFAASISRVTESPQVIAAGVNCTAPEFISELLDSIHNCPVPLVVYPNSGETWNPEGNRWSGESCETVPVMEWYEKGARILGGCCRVSSDAIRSIRADLDRCSVKPGGV
jgi:homocysteine S-methyltransferase